jgi:DNA-binding transcriptional ArsR family regulator
MCRQLRTIDLIRCKRWKIDQSERFIGSSGKVRRQKVAEGVASALTNRNLLLGSVGRKIREFVGIENVTKIQRNHGDYLHEHPEVDRQRYISFQTEVFVFKKRHNFTMREDLSIAANLLGDPRRAAMLLSLMGGIALPAGELATIANVTPQTASGHLARLVEGRLLSVECQGRHRYYRLSGPEVADAIESLLVLSTRSQPDRDPALCKASAGSLGHARTCYSHLAGWLGVRITETLQERGFLKPSDARTWNITPAGRAWIEALGIELPSSELSQKKLARRCLDWTERRHHLAGTLGCALYKRFHDLRWMAPVRDTRAVRVTLEGKRQLWDLLRIPIG